MQKQFLYLILTLFYQAVMAACSSADSSLLPVSPGCAATAQDSISVIADKVWAYSQEHPDGFTLNIRTMTAPTEGIAVSYAETQDSYSQIPSTARELSRDTREMLARVVSHALRHDGYVGGWLNGAKSRFYFDSTKLFPENDMPTAIAFGKENGQMVIFILSSSTEISLEGKVAEIVERGTLRVGTTGDYRPLSFCESDGRYWGFGIDMARELAQGLGLRAAFVKTSWPTLTQDVQAEPQTFDLAIGGITITDTRKATMLMSEGYLANGKTILCRASDADRFHSLEDLDRPEVHVMVNPGGLNEKFANEHLPHATIIVHPQNEEIPNLVAEGEADVMITEITEAPYYVQADDRLAAPLLNQPFTHGEIGVLMQQGQTDLLEIVNNTIRRMKADGSLRRLHEQYGLRYAY